jgi:hypothetical protein
MLPNVVYHVASAAPADMRWSAGTTMTVGARIPATVQKVERPFGRAVCLAFNLLRPRMRSGIGLRPMFLMSSTCSKLSRSGSTRLRRIVAAEQTHRELGGEAAGAVRRADHWRMARLELEAGAFVELEA